MWTSSVDVALQRPSGRALRATRLRNEDYASRAFPVTGGRGRRGGQAGPKPAYMRAADSSLRPSARRRTRNRGGCLRLAIVFSQCRMYEMLSDRGPLPIRVFRDLGAANAWLGIEPDDV